MSFFSFFKSKKAPLYAAIDVGSHAVKAVIFEKDSGRSNPKVLKKFVMKLPPEVESGRMVQKLREILFAVVKELGLIPEKITIALGPSIAKYSFETWQVGGAISNKITRSELEAVFTNLVSAHDSPDHFLMPYPLELLLNGYSVATLKAGKLSGPDGDHISPFQIPDRTSVSFRVLTLTFDPEIGKGLANLRQSFGGMPIQFIPMALAHHYTATEALGYKNAILIDIGGEVTTVTAIADSKIEDVVTFEVGGRHFLRGIARAADVSFDEAEDLKRQSSSEAISDEKGRQIRSFISDEFDFWKKNFLEALDAFYHVGPLPADVLLFGGGSNLKDISSYLREGTWIKDFSYVEKSQVRSLNGSDLFEGGTLNGFLQGPDEFSLGSLMQYPL